MSIELPPDLKGRVAAQFSSCQFENEEDVLREALGALEKRQRGQKELQQLVREADADVAAGRIGPFDPEETKRAVRQRLIEHGITD